MAAVLLMVGKQLEQPDIVQNLLDMNQYPCKPQYNYASEVMVLTQFFGTCVYMKLAVAFVCCKTGVCGDDEQVLMLCLIAGTPVILKVCV